jgi:hypothetical protein
MLVSTNYTESGIRFTNLIGDQLRCGFYPIYEYPKEAPVHPSAWYVPHLLPGYDRIYLEHPGKPAIPLYTWAGITGTNAQRELVLKNKKELIIPCKSIINDQPFKWPLAHSEEDPLEWVYVGVRRSTSSGVVRVFLETDCDGDSYTFNNALYALRRRRKERVFDQIWSWCWWNEIDQLASYMRFIGGALISSILTLVLYVKLSNGLSTGTAMMTSVATTMIVMTLITLLLKTGIRSKGIN